MRRLTISLVAAATLAAGLAPSAALAEHRHRGDRHDRYDQYSEHRGYWDRPGEQRRWNRHKHRHRRGPTVHYYPGYGYYEGSSHRGYRRDDRRDHSRSQWCARQYRSYDWNTGTFVGYDGVRRYCG